MKLNLPEALLLLSIDSKGNNQHRHLAYFSYSLASAVLLELLLTNRISFDEHKNIIVNPNIHLSDELLEELLIFCSVPNSTIYWTKLKKNSVAETPTEWVKIIHQFPKLQKRYYQKLIDKNIISKRVKKIVGLFSHIQFPIENTASKNEIILRIKQLIDKQDTSPTLRELMLLSLVKSAKLLQDILGIKLSEVKKAEEQVQEILHQKYAFNELDNSLRLDFGHSTFDNFVFRLSYFY